MVPTPHGTEHTETTALATPTKSPGIAQSGGRRRGQITLATVFALGTALGIFSSKIFNGSSTPETYELPKTASSTGPSSPEETTALQATSASTNEKPLVLEACLETQGKVKTVTTEKLQKRTPPDLMREKYEGIFSDLQLAKKLIRSSLKLILDNTYCSGVIIDEKTAMTAAHCLQRKKSEPRGQMREINGIYAGEDIRNEGLSATEIYIRHGKPSYRYRYHQKLNGSLDPENDLAIIEFEKPIFKYRPHAPIKKTATEIGDVLVTVGHGGGIPWKIEIEDVDEIAEGTVDIATQTLGGDSGGPAFDTTGKLVGLMVKGHAATKRIEPIGINEVEFLRDTDKNKALERKSLLAACDIDTDLLKMPR